LQYKYILQIKHSVHANSSGDSSLGEEDDDDDSEVVLPTDDDRVGIDIGVLAPVEVPRSLDPLVVLLDFPTLVALKDADWNNCVIEWPT
jgi:hypothetical protein